MANCQACGTDILSNDRFCKNCGAPAAASVEDLADTHRFDGHTPQAAAATPDLFEASTTYPLIRSSAPLIQTTSFIKSLVGKNLIWVVALVLIFVLVGGGLTIGREVARTRRAERAAQAQRTEREVLAKRARRVEETRRAFQEAIQNALGFVPEDVSDLEYPDTKGVFVANLTSDDSPAAMARIEAGDVLTEFNEKPVPSIGQLAQALNSSKPGAEVMVKLHRDDTSLVQRIRIASQFVAPLQPKVEPREQGFLGTADVARRCCVPGTRKWGLEIHRVIDNSPADLAGLQIGDIITEFDKHPVRTPAELARRIHAAKPRTTVRVKYFRGTSEQLVELKTGHGW